MRISLLSLAVLAVAPLGAAQNFSYPDFSSVSGLVLNQDAAQFGGNILRLTPALNSAGGSCYYSTAVNVVGGFETVFTFQALTPTCSGADGIAFIVHNDPRTTSFIGEVGGEICYGGGITTPPGTGASNALVIELDSYPNGTDLSGNEVSVHTNGTGESHSDEMYSIGSVIPGTNMWDTLVHTCKITYTPGTLSVYIDDLNTPELVTAYDFATGGTWINGGGPVGGFPLINGTSAYVGFTASCGGCTETHDILSWDWGAGGPGTAYCFGDLGVGTPCPCGNDNDGSVPESGCANGVFASGAKLTGGGVASVSADSLILITTGLEPNNAGLYFQADNDLSPGQLWGDGLQCAGGSLKRLGVRFADGTGYSDTSGYPQPISVKAGNIFPGDTKRYQCWYRNIIASPCGNNFNASNGYAVIWAP